MRGILIMVFLICSAQAGAAEAPKVLALAFSEDSLTLDITTSRAVWRFGMDTGTVLDHRPHAEGAAPTAAQVVAEDGVRSPGEVWTASVSGPTAFSDGTWVHIRLHRKEEEHGATLSLGADRAWLVEVHGPWFIGNEAALRPLCETWSYPFRTLDKAVDRRIFADAVGFWRDGIGGATPTSKPSPRSSSGPAAGSPSASPAGRSPGGARPATTSTAASSSSERSSPWSTFPPWGPSSSNAAAGTGRRGHGIPTPAAQSAMTGMAPRM